MWLVLFNSPQTPPIAVPALRTSLCHFRNSSAWRSQGVRTSSCQKQANLANCLIVFSVMGNNKEELEYNALHLPQLSTSQKHRSSDAPRAACWDANTFVHWLEEAQKGTHRGCCRRIPFIKSFASSLKWTKSGMVHEISPFWIFRRVPRSFSPANGDLHVRLIYWTS